MTDPEGNSMGRLYYENGYATLAIERFYNHPRTVVWDAMTDNEQLNSWFIAKVRMIPGSDGFIESWFGQPLLHVEGKITSWEPPHLLEHEWNIQPNDVVPEGEFSTMRWELEDLNGGTLLKLTHRNLTKQTMAGFRTGLDPAPADHIILERLESYLSSKPFFDVHTRFTELKETYHKLP